MKKKIRALLVLIVCAALLYTGLTESNINTVQAASKAEGTIDLKAKKLTIPKGKTQKIKNKTLTMVQKRKYQVKSKFGSTTVTTKGTYKSSKTSVATVSSTGLVTAKAPGTATISVTYNGTKQTFKVKVVASHTHSWKTTSKATCAAKGKRLCKTCGVVGSTAKKTTHTWKTTKKATCETKGSKTCTVCGVKESIAKTAHKYVTGTWTGVEGRGKISYATSHYCNGCNIDMTNWTREQMQAHWYDIDGMDAGTANWKCFGAGTNGVGGEERYSKYMMVDLEETYCKTCGISKNKTKTDLYEVYYDEWKNVVRKSDDKIIQESNAYKAYKPYLEAAKKAAASTAASQAKAAPKAAMASVATFSLMNDEIAMDDNVMADGNIAVAGEAIEAGEAVVPAGEVLVEDAEAISGNEAVSDNDIEITDLETGSDIVFEKADTETENDGIAILATDANDGIMVTSLENENGIAIETAKNDTIVSADVILEKPVYIEKTIISGNDIILTNELVSDSKLATVNAKTNGNFVALLSHAVVDDNKEEPEEEDVVIVEEDDEDEVVTEEDEEGEIVPEDE